MKLRSFSGILLGMIPSGLMAAGYYLPNQDAFATARGNAFVATADSAAAVFYNPAGMTQLTRPEAQVGAYAIVLGNEANINGKSYDADSEVQVAPSVFYAQPYNDKLSFGFGLNSPFGLGTEWGRDKPFSPVITEARLTYISATSAVAYKVTDELSIGASISLNYADLLLEQGLGYPGSYFKYAGDDFGVSGSLSIRWQPSEQHAFGLVYSSKSEFNLDGKTQSNLFLTDNSASMDFMTPARIAGGYSYRPAPGWNIEANVEWLDYDSLNTLKLDTSSVPGTDSVPVTFDWQSSFIYEIGASYTNPDGYIF
ncbi:MAG: outer membrane protein transport protein, partial [Gloeobacteraceae cyanobacterium ES-bin-144]|nr:outer membrane protein transport protein [Verrucomicrobiales bacterium]